jgi:hypothetical protein
MTTTTSAMINAGEVGEDVTMLINDAGRIVFRTPGQSVVVDAGQLAEALKRVTPVVGLVARSKTPISGMSAPIARSLEHFGCTVEEG